MRPIAPFAFLLLLLVAAASRCAAQADSGYHTTRHGVRMRMLVDSPGTQHPAVGDYIEFHIYSHVGDSVIFDSRAMNNNEAVPFQLTKPAFAGDLTYGLMSLTAGDSAHFLIPVDEQIKAGNQLLPWLEAGKGLMQQYEIKVVSVMTPAQQKEARRLHQQRQLRIDDSLLRAYFKSHGITATKTKSGLYYRMHSRGKGLPPAAGDSVTIAYTGRTTDERKFDSNTDSAFSHPVPFGFRLNQRQVIKGWDEGIALLPKGTKATLYIPSVYAYGNQSPGPAIPANAILIFDVEVLDIFRKPKSKQQKP